MNKFGEDDRISASGSCGAAEVVKPKARLGEPWVVVVSYFQSREAATES